MYKAFIKQTPFALAMLDNDLKYIACSDKWIEDHFDPALPGTSYKSTIRPLGINWTAVISNCLQGKIETCEEGLCQREDGSMLWLKWDIRPWYSLDYKIGGLLIFTQDITESKQKDAEARKITEILNKTNDITRIGVWKRNLDSNVTTWSAMMQEILEVPDDFEPNLATIIDFYKEGKDREMVEQAKLRAIEKGIPFDIEGEIITAKGNSKRVRVIGYPEFLNGKCERMFGVLQDITHKELAKLMVVSSFMFDLFQ
jgi:PAS domain-containing protein